MTCKCGNEARYINELGEFCCATCPLKGDLDSIRLTDVPPLLSWCRDLQTYLDTGSFSMGELASIIGRGPKR